MRPDEFLTKTEAATVCGMSERNFDRWKSKPGFPQANDAGMFSQNEVLAYCKAHGVRTVTINKGA